MGKRFLVLISGLRLDIDYDCFNLDNVDIVEKCREYPRLFLSDFCCLLLRFEARVFGRGKSNVDSRAVPAILVPYGDLSFFEGDVSPVTLGQDGAPSHSYSGRTGDSTTQPSEWFAV